MYCDDCGHYGGHSENCNFIKDMRQKQEIGAVLAKWLELFPDVDEVEIEELKKQTSKLIKRLPSND